MHVLKTLPWDSTRIPLGLVWWMQWFLKIILNASSTPSHSHFQAIIYWPPKYKVFVNDFFDLLAEPMCQYDRVNFGDFVIHVCCPGKLLAKDLFKPYWHSLSWFEWLTWQSVIICFIHHLPSFTYFYSIAFNPAYSCF